MQANISLILFLLLCPQFGYCDLDCQILSNVDFTSLKINPTAIDGLNIDLDRNKHNLLVLECNCDDDSKVIVMFLKLCKFVNVDLDCQVLSNVDFTSF